LNGEGRDIGYVSTFLSGLSPTIETLELVQVSMETIIATMFGIILRVTIKVNAVLYYRIIDPFRAINKVENYEDVEIPTNMQRAMAKEAEAVREKRARLIKASAEQEASIKLAEASQKIVENPAALELRRLQMLTEIGAENNTTTLIMMPSDFITLAKQWTEVLDQGNKVERNGVVQVKSTDEPIPLDLSSIPEDNP
jgi:regulator of protease activity HflC (stomatin/prohibitin superfamily)